MNSKIRQELDYFLSGLSFYTRLPCPSSVVYRPENFNKSRKYLPLIGLLVGLVAAVVYFLSSLVFPSSVSILLSMIMTVYLTGAFHEDGFADSCDGFGGGWDKSQVLTIMKDSRVGTYGVVGLFLMLGLKFCVLLELQQRSTTFLLLGLLCGHSLSRLMASLIMQRYTYVSAVSTSKSQSVTSMKLSRSEILLSAIPAIIFLVIVWRFSFFLAVVVMSIVTLLLGQYFKQRIGGYTGDCLGAVQQTSEVVFYLVVLACVST